MNTNQFWNPITLASTINKTPSFESLSDEEKIQRRLDRMENTVNECNNVINTHNNNVQKYYNRISEIINKTSIWVNSLLASDFSRKFEKVLKIKKVFLGETVSKMSL